MHVAVLLALSSLAVNMGNGAAFEDSSGCETNDHVAPAGETCEQSVTHDCELISFLRIQRGEGGDAAVKGDDSAALTEGDDSAAETPMDDLMTALAGVGGGGGGRVGGAAVGRILGNDCGLIARFPRSTASLDLLLAVGFTVVDNAKSSEEEQSEN
eukprot:gnl/TRDRNA2_/TRDRNA2_172436_c1_seq2.p1 gnl/TRDRNA2_/TRDRNA2_172436_c1~~gnl/TRDRNA2_/TRDRNA2_172436_c1_seq2.p1  ORF type:complete len:156 (+),score=23.51 gnl/TRDRNA2_/TRDRNA2_172436_c1_seq2:71-538(+)